MITDLQTFLLAGAEAIQDTKIARDEQSDKTCSKCDTTKPLTDFYANHSQCKQCHTQTVRAKQYEGAVPTIYAITSGTKIVYVGSTRMSLTARLQAHRSAASQGRGTKIANFLRSNPENVNIIALETLQGASKQTLLYSEKQWIRRLSKTNKLHQTRNVIY